MYDASPSRMEIVMMYSHAVLGLPPSPLLTYCSELCFLNWPCPKCKTGQVLVFGQPLPITAVDLESCCFE